jgi:hypothetical protein
MARLLDPVYFYPSISLLKIARSLTYVLPPGEPSKFSVTFAHVRLPCTSLKT